MKAKDTLYTDFKLESISIFEADLRFYKYIPDRCAGIPAEKSWVVIQYKHEKSKYTTGKCHFIPYSVYTNYDMVSTE